MDRTRLTIVDWAVFALIFTLILALYVQTLAPGLLWGDSGEFQTLVYTLGMTHPTGYPIYLLAGRLFTLLPLGSLAYRVNLFSAVLGATATALAYLGMRQMRGWRLPSLGIAIALGIIPLFWWQSVMAELYSGAAALIAGIMLLVVTWNRSRRPGLLFWAGLLGGLSLGVHNTVALTAPGIIVYLVLSRCKWKDWREAIGGALLGVILTLGAFLALDAYNAPVSYYNTTLRHAVSAWDLTAEQVDSPFERLKFLYGARQFRMYMFANPRQIMPESWMQYKDVIKESFSSAAIFLTIAGIAMALFRKTSWREAVLLLLAGAGMLGFILNYTIGDIQVFYVPTFILIALGMGLGIGALLDGVNWLTIRAHLPDSGRTVLLTLVGVALLFGILQPGWSRVATSWKLQRIAFLKAGSWEARYPYPVSSPEEPHRVAASLVDRLEPNAMVFTSWDKVFPYYYVAALERGRTEMSFYEEFVQDGMTGAATSSLALIDANLGKRPIYFDHDPFSNVIKRYILAKVNGAPALLQVVRKR